MARLRESMLRFWATLRRKRPDREMEEELRSHLELVSEDMRRRGVSIEDAPRAARLQVGGVAQAMEAMRDQQGLPWLDDLARDVRYALRTLGNTPAFTVVALLTLALGIGANTAIFSIVNGVILRPLPYPKPEQLMHLSTQEPAIGLMQFPLSAPEYLEFRKINQSFAAVGAYTIGEMNMTADERALRVRLASVDDHLLNALGVQPQQGRLFSPGEADRSGAAAPGQPAPLLPPIVILSLTIYGKPRLADSRFWGRW